MPTTDYKDASGNRCFGTTTIISRNLGWNKDPLMKWAWRLGKEGKEMYAEKEFAGDAGTLVHHWIEQRIRQGESYSPLDDPYVNQFKQEVRDAATRAYKNFMNWWSGANVTPIEMEISRVSELGYGLTPDLIGYVNGRLSLVDWKSSRGMYSDYLIQMAAYIRGWEEHDHENRKIEAVHVLKFSKESARFTHYQWERSELEPAWQAFAALLRLESLRPKLEGLIT